MPCHLGGSLSSARGNKMRFDEDVARHLGARQASGADGAAGCAAAVNALGGTG